LLQVEICDENGCYFKKIKISPELFENKQDFELITQAALVSTNTFNYLSEDFEARERLYNVCWW